MSMTKAYFDAFVAYCHEHRPRHWALDVCPSSGTLMWFNFRKRNVYATPDWSVEGIVPVDVSTDDEESCVPHPLWTHDFVLPVMSSAHARAQMYLDRLRPYLDHMPDVHPEPLMASIAGKQYVKAHYHERWCWLTPNGWCKPVEDSVNDLLERVHAELLGAVST